MSRAYRISVKESLSRHVQVEDGVSSSLELLPILEKERMRELLAAELVQRGFTREGQLAKRDEGKGVTVEVDLETGEVTVSAEGHKNVDLETQRTTVVDRDAGGMEAKEKHLRDAAKEALERDAAAHEAALQREVTARLEGKLKDLRQELDGAVNRVTGEALKQRARELGEVQEIHEEPNGSLTIKVRV